MITSNEISKRNEFPKNESPDAIAEGSTFNRNPFTFDVNS